MTDNKMDAWAERLNDWFDLQLTFADALVAKCGLTFDQAITHYTALHKRFGFGRPGTGTAGVAWRDFVENLSEMKTRTAQLGCIKAFARSRLVSYSHYAGREFGCFNFDPPGEEGSIKLHFSGDSEEGPLSRRHMASRRSELAALFACVRKEHGEDVKSIVGASWLYNLDAYTRLLPPAFTAAATTYQHRALQPCGMGFWGQFLDHDENIKPAIRDAFLANIRTIDLATLWTLFPLPVKIAKAPPAEFYKFYAV